jgi:hypothetical protein
MSKASTTLTTFWTAESIRAGMVVTSLLGLTGRDRFMVIDDPRIEDQTRRFGIIDVAGGHITAGDYTANDVANWLTTYKAVPQEIFEALSDFAK